MKIGVFGGTFDPPHLGHLVAVEAARELLSLNFVRVIPAALSPHKIWRETSPAEIRLEMVRLAFAGNASFIIDEREIQRKGPSYMVDTLSDLRTEFPGDSLVLLLGRDTLKDFDTWKEPDRILALAEVVALERQVAGLESGDSPILKRITRLKTPLVEVSASMIRERVREGKSIRYMVPEGVREYIERHRLYR
ncbi:MAG: nicotinate-nucleotide adenylyltransferase [Bacteroidota bacterium]